MTIRGMFLGIGVTGFMTNIWYCVEKKRVKMAKKFVGLRPKMSPEARTLTSYTSFGLAFSPSRCRSAGFSSRSVPM
jgi:hypothetical protein